MRILIPEGPISNQPEVREEQPLRSLHMKKRSHLIIWGYAMLFPLSAFAQQTSGTSSSGTGTSSGSTSTGQNSSSRSSSSGESGSSSTTGSAAAGGNLTAPGKAGTQQQDITQGQGNTTNAQQNINQGKTPAGNMQQGVNQGQTATRNMQGNINQGQAGRAASTGTISTTGQGTTANNPPGTYSGMMRSDGRPATPDGTLNSPTMRDPRKSTNQADAGVSPTPGATPAPSPSPLTDPGTNAPSPLIPIR